MIRLESFQGLLQLAGGVLLLAFGGFAGQEHLGTMAGQGRTQLDFSIAVTGRDIEVVDPAIDGGLHPLFRLPGRGIHHDNAAKAEDGKALAGAAQGASLEPSGGLFPGNGLEGCREAAQQRGRSRGGPFEELSSFHGGGG